jgi:hypothetical protein
LRIRTARTGPAPDTIRACGKAFCRPSRMNSRVVSSIAIGRLASLRSFSQAATSAIGLSCSFQVRICPGIASISAIEGASK